MAAVLPVLKTVIKSKAFKGIVGLLAAALTAWASAGCGMFSAPKAPALGVFECRARVLEPYVADAATALVAQISSGTVNPVQLLLSLGLTSDEILAVAKAYHECAPPAPPAPPPSSVIEG